MYDRLLFILFLKIEFYNLILSTFCNDHNFLPGFNVTTDINNEFLIITWKRLVHWKAVSADTVGTINESLGNAQLLLSKTEKRISAKVIEKRENKDDK